MAARINTILFLLFITSATVVLGLKLKNFNVPEHHLVDGNGSDDLLLHCEYDVDPLEDEGHVLRWMFNGSMIFQWIPEKNSVPSVFNDQFISRIVLPTDPQEPIRIKNPNYNFTGNYSCEIAALKKRFVEHGHVQVVDVSKAAVKLNHKIDDDSIDIECNSTESYPRPVLNFIVNSEVLPVQVTHKLRDDGHYDASLSATFNKQEILDKGSKFGCQLVVGTEKFNVSKTDLVDLNETGGCNTIIPLSRVYMIIFSIIIATLFDQM